VPAGHSEAYSLNCIAARPIPPPGKVGFAMRIAVPHNAPLGHNGLFWILDPFGRQAPEFDVRANVR
jgi:hypothetical protein